MNHNAEAREFDVIIIGSGTAGATIARELGKQKKKVLLLEKGNTVPLRETLMGIVSIADEVKLGEGGLSTIRAVTTGGSTGLYFGVVSYPQVEVFRSLGVDLTKELAEVADELPITQVPDALLSPQAVRLRDSATALGRSWQKYDMLIDLAKCSSAYSYDAKWKARKYVDEAVGDGATLVTRATVLRILVDNKTAIGVEYKLKTGPFGSEIRRAYASKIVLSAGELASPKILRDSGVEDVGRRGFFCNPGYAIYGLVPDLKGTDGFVGAMGCAYADDIELGDANVARPLHGPMMLGGLKIKHMLSFPRTLGIGVKVKDGLGGELRADGRFHKTFSREDQAKLDKGRQEAVRILEKAGARHIVDFGLTAAGRVGGLVRIQEHVDEKLETPLRNLHVCDGSVIPDELRGPPTLTLVCLGKYLSKHLASQL